MNHFLYKFSLLLMIISANTNHVEAASEWEKREYSNHLNDLKVGNISDLEIHTEEISHHLEEIKLCLHNNNHVTTVDFKECAINDSFLKDLASCLASCSSLTILNLNAGLSTCDGLATLLPIRNLRELHLEQNNLPNAVIGVVLQFKKLEILDLSSNVITTEGALELSHHLPPNLVKIDLSHNEICDAAIIQFSKVLEKNNTLKLLGLAGTKITNKGAKTLISVLRNKNKTLISFNELEELERRNLIPSDWCDENWVSEVNRKKIEEFLTRNINYSGFPKINKDLLIFSNFDFMTPLINICGLRDSLTSNKEAFNLQGSEGEEEVRYDREVMAIDPAGSGRDETGYAVVKRAKDYFFLVDSGGLKDGHKLNTLQQLIGIAKIYNIREFVVENNYTQGLYFEFFSYVVHREYPEAKVIRYFSKGEKKERIITLLHPVIQGRKLIISNKTAKINEENAEKKNDFNYSLIYQLSNIHSHSLKHDDRVDALAIAISVTKKDD